METKLHKWEEKHKELCFVNMQKNLPVYNLKTEKEDFIFKNVRLYQADDVDRIIKERELELLEWLWYTTSDEGQQRRYAMIYDKVVEMMNNLKKELGK